MINKQMMYFKKQHEIFSLFKKQHEIFSLIMISSIYSSFKIIFETGFILLRKSPYTHDRCMTMCFSLFASRLKFQKMSIYLDNIIYIS